MKKLLHFFSHLFKMNTGDVISWRENDTIYIAFKCRECEKIFDIRTIKGNNYDNFDR